VQTELVDRNRKDSLQLLRIQNDLNLLAVAMRDMIDNDEHYPLTAWAAQFQRIRADLDDAMRREEGLAATAATPGSAGLPRREMTQFWDAVDRVFALARDGKEKAAREQIQLSLQARQAALSTAVARLLVQNSESEELARAAHCSDLQSGPVAGVRISGCNAGSEFWLTGLSLIRWIRYLFARMAKLSSNAAKWRRS